MVEIEFNYNQNFTVIQSNEGEKMKIIIQKYLDKTGFNKDSIYFLYSGTNIDEEKTLKEIINSQDKSRKKMSILVTNLGNDNTNPTSSIIISKNIICPKCKKSAKFNIKDYKIILECQEGHKTCNIFLNKFKDTQKIDLSKIICDQCHNNNKSETFQNSFFICNTCKINLCPACKSIHDKSHHFINYDDKDHICDIHNEKYSFYCQNCEKNICIYCENEHLEHKIISYGRILPDLNRVETNFKILKEKIDKVKKITLCIVERLKKTIDNFENYYNIISDIYKTFQKNQLNYQILLNINEINNNKDIINDINSIIKNKNINEQFKMINNIYEQMLKEEDEELTIIYNLKDFISSSFFTKKYLDNSTIKIFGKKFVENNKNLVKMIIENKIYELSSEFKLENLKNINDILSLKLKGVQKITNMNYMFESCSLLKNFDNINTENIKSMIGLFSKCSALTKIPNISYFNTKNVTNMKRMFFACSSLKSLPDISNWNTSNVTNMSFMFYECSSLKSLPGINKWDLSKVKYLYRMFYNCKGLENLPDISVWNTRSVINMRDMFCGCCLLKSVPEINKWDLSKISEIDWMFAECKGLQKIPDISKWNLNGNVKVDNMFNGCKN